jgi:hypothetical protein
MPIVGSFAGASARAYGLGAGGAIGDFESIQTITAGSAVASIDFTSIPATYTHLQIRGQVRNTAGGGGGNQNLYIRFNGISTVNNYSWHYLEGDGATASSGSGVNQAQFFAGRIAQSTYNASVFSRQIIDVLDYSNTNKYKTVRILSGVDDNSANGVVTLLSGAFINSTNAISSILLLPQAGTFAQYTSFALYGVKA